MLFSLRARWEPRQSARCLFFFNDTTTTEIYTLSLHDALPISDRKSLSRRCARPVAPIAYESGAGRSEEHTSELQSLRPLVCRLLLEKKLNPNQDMSIGTVKIHCTLLNRSSSPT